MMVKIAQKGNYCRGCGQEPEPNPNPGAYIPGGWAYYGCTSCNAMVGLNLLEFEHRGILETRNADKIELYALNLLINKWNLFFSANEEATQNV